MAQIILDIYQWLTSIEEKYIPAIFGIIGSLTGSLIGGTIAFRIHIRTLKSQERERRQSSEEKERAIANSIIFKLIKINSYATAFCEHLEDAYERNKINGEKIRSWQTVLPLMGNFYTINFSPEEGALILKIKEDSLFNKFMMSDDKYNNTVRLFEIYAEKRQELTRYFPAKMKGSVGETVLTEEQMLIVRPKMFELDNIITKMIQCSNSDLSDSKYLIENFIKIFNAKLNLKYKLDQ